MITTFVTSTYPLLQPSHADASLALLAQISAQLNNISPNTPTDNTTRSAMTVDQAIQSTTQRASAAIIIANMFLFVSLIMALGVAVLCLQSKEWLRHFQEDLCGNSMQTSLLREYRYFALQKWIVPTIIQNIPPVLEWAILAFIVGLGVFLGTLHPAIATICILLLSVLYAFSLITSMLPAFHDDCAYVTAGGRHFFEFIQHTTRHSRRFRTFLAFLRRRVGPPSKDCSLLSLRAAIANTLTWGDYTSWSQRERVQASRWGDGQLGARLLWRAIVSSRDVAFIRAPVRQCIADLSLLDAVPLMDSLWKFQVRLFGRRTSVIRSEDSNAARLALHYLDLDVLLRLEDEVAGEGEDPAHRIVKRMLRINEAWPSSEQIDEKFFPVMAKYAQRQDDCGTMAFAVIRDALINPRLEHAFPPGNEQHGTYSHGFYSTTHMLTAVCCRTVLDAAEVISLRRGANGIVEVEDYKAFFQCCSMVLRAQWTLNMTSDVRVSERVQNLLRTLQGMLRTPLWRRWSGDESTLWEYVTVFWILKVMSETTQTEAVLVTLLAPQLLDAADDLQWRIIGEGISANLEYVTHHTTVVSECVEKLRRSLEIVGAFMCPHSI